MNKQMLLARHALDRCRDQFRDSQAFLRAAMHREFLGHVPISANPKKAPPAEWRWIGLLDSARLESGHTPSRRRPEWWGGKIPWLSLPDIRKLHGQFVYETLEYTNDAGIANSSARMLPVGTVCVSRTASIGFVTILGKPMSTSQDFCNWVCNPEKLDPEFLMYAFMGEVSALVEHLSISVS